VVFHCNNGTRAFCAKFVLEGDEPTDISTTAFEESTLEPETSDMTTEEPMTTEEFTTEEPMTTGDVMPDTTATVVTEEPIEEQNAVSEFDFPEDLPFPTENVTQDFDYEVTAIFEAELFGAIVMKPTGDYSVYLEVPSSVSDVCDQLRYSIYETWTDSENDELSGLDCAMATGNGVWDPTFSCMPGTLTRSIA